MPTCKDCLMLSESMSGLLRLVGLTTYFSIARITNPPKMRAQATTGSVAKLLSFFSSASPANPAGMVAMIQFFQNLIEDGSCLKRETTRAIRSSR